MPDCARQGVSAVNALTYNFRGREKINEKKEVYKIMEGETTALTALLSTITEVFTAAVGWVGTVATTITNTPLLMVGCVLGFIGVGLFKRMFNI